MASDWMNRWALGPEGIKNFFGGNAENPADNAMPYLQQIPGAISGYYDPYINAGKQALPTLQDQYSKLINDPGGFMNKMGEGFQQSPGFKFALDQALRGAGHAAAAGGMAGSPMHEQNAMNLATQMGNQDYYNWLQHAQGMYGMGLGGMGNMAGMGLEAGKGLSDQIAQALAAQAQLQYAGGAAQNQQQGAWMNNLMSGLGTLAAFL